VSLGLYVHVPFCAAICNYCNFNRGLFDESLKQRYVAAVIEDIQRSGDGAPVDTIFFGGGTPSLLEPAEVASIVAACRGGFMVSESTEVTLEANPETVSAGRFSAFRDAGVNRVSIGVQSFREDELRRLSRLHSSERAQAALGDARQAGFDNVSLDLMMWLPGQSVADWLESVDRLIAVAPDHASLYLLELYPNAPLREDMARGRWSLAPDDDAAEMYLQGMARLDAAGYRQYEISNVARPGRASRHNMKYWRDGEWLGFGCGAHSTRAGVRWKNLASTSDYVERIGAGNTVVSERRILSRQDRFEEAMFMGLRLAEGIDVSEFSRRYDRDVWSEFSDDLGPFLDAALLIYDGARLRLTRQGMLLANDVMAVFLDSKRTIE